MPVVRVFTAIPAEDHERLKQKAKELRMSEYKLAQEAILIYINEPEKSRLKRIMAFIEEDLKRTF